MWGCFAAVFFIPVRWPDWAFALFVSLHPTHGSHMQDENNTEHMRTQQESADKSPSLALVGCLLPLSNNSRFSNHHQMWWRLYWSLYTNHNLSVDPSLESNYLLTMKKQKKKKAYIKERETKANEPLSGAIYTHYQNFPSCAQPGRRLLHLHLAVQGWMQAHCSAPFKGRADRGSHSIVRHATSF